jgi:hypothetical protein
MSVEITYDPTDVDAGEFSPDEMDSLQVGENLAQAEERQLAGKYANAEELEQAYLNLQQKMGEQSTDEEYDEEYGALTDETIQALAENMDADELIQLGMQMNEDTPEDLDQQDVSAIQNFVGGEEAYASLIGWAGENLDQQYIEAFDSVVDTADPAAIQLVVAGLMATYQENAGYEGRMLSGRNAPDVGGIQPFRSQAQVVAAMSDPRYDNDPAYRADIAARLEISNTFFE